MAFYGKKKSRNSSIRLTGMFKVKTKRGLCVGSVDDVAELTDVVKRAIKAEKGVVFFLWRNEETEEGQPLFTLYADVSNDDGARPKRRAIVEPEEEEEEDPDAYLDSAVQRRPVGPRRATKVPADDDVPF